MKQNISLKIATYNAKIQRPPSRLTHFTWGVLSQQAGKKTSRKQKIQALNHEGNPGKPEACSVIPSMELK